MKVGIIGAGKVGCAFALALAYKEVRVLGAFSRSRESAEYLNKRLNLSSLKISSVRDLVNISDTLLITVPDSEIPNSVSEILAECDRNDLEGKVFMHCSGSATSLLLKPLEAAGAYIGTLHPAQTFPEKENSWKSMFSIYFGYEGSTEARKCAKTIVEKLGGIMLDLKAETKPLYHAAACVISNYTATLAHFAGELMEAAGINREAGMIAFSPLFSSTVKNIYDLGSVAALTGPIARGDAVTIEEHLHAIEVVRDKTRFDLSGLYKALGRETVKLAVIQGSLTGEKADELMKLLSDGS